MPKGYSSAQIGLHWIIALLIALMFLFNEPIGEAYDSLKRGIAPPLQLGRLGPYRRRDRYSGARKCSRSVPSPNCPKALAPKTTTRVLALPAAMSARPP